MGHALGKLQGTECSAQATSFLHSFGWLGRTKIRGRTDEPLCDRGVDRFSNQMVLACGQRLTEKDLEEGCKRRTPTVSRWRRPGPLFYIPEIRRSARMGFLKRVVLSLKRDSMKRQKALSLLQLLIELAITLLIAGVVVPSLLRSGAATSEAWPGFSPYDQRCRSYILLHVQERWLCDPGLR